MDGRETATVKRARFTAYFHAGVAQDIASTVKVKKRVVAGSNSARTSPQNHINFQRALELHRILSFGEKNGR